MVRPIERNNGLTMPPLALPRIILRRFQADWKLVLSVFAGIAVATALGTAAPVFLSALKQLSFNVAVERLAGDGLSFRVFGADIDLTRESLVYHSGVIDKASAESIADIALPLQTYFRGDTFLVGLPDRPLPEHSYSTDLVGRGYLSYMSDLDQHGRFLQGRMPGNSIQDDESGPFVEAAISSATAEEFGLKAGDQLAFAPSPGAAREIHVNIVGVFEPRDAADVSLVYDCVSS